jgi:MFS family permease
MIIKRMQPARYLGGLMFIWGLIATFSCFVQNFAGLVVCRLLLGTFEAGLFPGVILYLSMFYNKRNVSLRQAWFYGTSAIAGGLGVRLLPLSLQDVLMLMAIGLTRVCDW